MKDWEKNIFVIKTQFLSWLRWWTRKSHTIKYYHDMWGSYIQVLLIEFKGKKKKLEFFSSKAPEETFEYLLSLFFCTAMIRLDCIIIEHKISNFSIQWNLVKFA